VESVNAIAIIARAIYLLHYTRKKLDRQ
jgi:hypothetical protein